MELNKVLERVRQLIAKAEHTIAEGATPAEREAALKEQENARRMADDLMMKYAIEEASLDKNRPAANRSKPGKIEIGVTGEFDLAGHVATLASDIARHCNCRIRHYTRWADGEWKSNVYGYESDIRYFEILYTTIRLHMLGALRPKPDPVLSLEDNTYRLHNAGLNWYEIAQVYGWRETESLPNEPKLMYRNNNTNERKGWSQAVAQYRRAYQRAIAARGEAPLRIPPAGSRTFRRSSAQGYSIRISQRLQKIRDGRNVGTALALRSDELDKLFRAENPDLFQEFEEPAKKVRMRKYVPPPFSEAAYEVGVNHANTANLDPAAEPDKTRAIS